VCGSTHSPRGVDAAASLDCVNHRVRRRNDIVGALDNIFEGIYRAWRDGGVGSFGGGVASCATDLFGGCDQLAEAADFEGGILQSGQCEASVVARLAQFLHVINDPSDVSVQETILIRQQQRA